MKSALLATAVTGGLVGVVGVADTASASANGCTRGPNISTICIDVTGWGLFVASTDVSQSMGPQGWATVCNYSASWTGTYESGAGASKLVGPADHCSSYKAWLEWSPQKTFKHDSNFCGRFKSDQTSFAWSPAACVKIKK